MTTPKIGTKFTHPLFHGTLTLTAIRPDGVLVLDAGGMEVVSNGDARLMELAPDAELSMAYAADLREQKADGRPAWNIPTLSSHVVMRGGEFLGGHFNTKTGENVLSFGPKGWRYRFSERTASALARKHGGVAVPANSPAAS